MILNEINIMMDEINGIMMMLMRCLMERSKMFTNKIKHTALLSRLSREDDLQGDNVFINL